MGSALASGLAWAPGLAWARGLAISRYHTEPSSVRGTLRAFLRTSLWTKCVLPMRSRTFLARGLVRPSVIVVVNFLMVVVASGFAATRMSPPWGRQAACASSLSSNRMRKFLFAQDLIGVLWFASFALQLELSGVDRPDQLVVDTPRIRAVGDVQNLRLIDQIVVKRHAVSGEGRQHGWRVKC